MEHLSLLLQLHTQEELIFFSNLAHWIEGGLFFFVAIVAFLHAIGYFKAKWTDYLWPTIILMAGLFLPIFTFSHHFDEMELAWKATIFDPQQRQHCSSSQALVKF